jgi:hypothetical protein
LPRVDQEPAQVPAASSSTADALHDVGSKDEAAEVIGSDADEEAVELEHPNLMAESDAHHKKGTFKDPLMLQSL